MYALKLALNKSMRASDDEQIINKLRPKRKVEKIKEIKKTEAKRKKQR